MFRTLHPQSGRPRIVYFQVDSSGLNATQLEADRHWRTMVAGRDGSTPEQAFVVGGNIGAEYSMLQLMGFKRDIQMLRTVRGCAFDVLAATSVDTGEQRDFFFLLGRPGFDYSGVCTLKD